MPLPFHPSRAAAAAFRGASICPSRTPPSISAQRRDLRRSGKAIKSLGQEASRCSDVILSGWMPPLSLLASGGGVRAPGPVREVDFIFARQCLNSFVPNRIRDVKCAKQKAPVKALVASNTLCGAAVCQLTVRSARDTRLFVSWHTHNVPRRMKRK